MMYSSVRGGDASDIDFPDSSNTWFTATECTEDRAANHFFSERRGAEDARSAEDAHRLYRKTREGAFPLCCIYHIPEQRSSDPSFFTITLVHQV